MNVLFKIEFPLPSPERGRNNTISLRNRFPGDIGVERC
jgi:hypothetical protein